MIDDSIVRQFKTIVGEDSAWTDATDLHTYSYDAAVVDPVQPGLIVRSTTAEALAAMLKTIKASPPGGSGLVQQVASGAHDRSHELYEIVRGTTLVKIVGMLRQAGAREPARALRCPPERSAVGLRHRPPDGCVHRAGSTSWEC